jgi:hypothetical protein
MCADNARFFNHSDDPTCLDFGPHTAARYDLTPGTELTSDYRSFCRDPFLGFPTTTPPDSWSLPESRYAPKTKSSATPMQLSVVVVAVPKFLILKNCHHMLALSSHLAITFSLHNKRQTHRSAKR